MRQQSGPQAPISEQIFKDIRRATRKHDAAEEKIRIVLEGLRGEYSIAELCCREGIAESLYYNWSKEFLEAGKRRLNSDTERAITTPEVKELVADLGFENRVLKKNMIGDGGTRHEVPRIREGRNYPAGRAVTSAGEANVGDA